MDFAQPIYFVCFVPLFFFGLTVWLLSRRSRKAMEKLGTIQLIQRLTATVNLPGRRWKVVLIFLALSLLIIALARPRWGSQIEYVERQGVEIMIALDISQSMLAEDLKPTRLARAKLEITELMNQLGGNDIGLVVFSGAAFVQFPLTSDFATARMFLDSVHTNMISRPGTAVSEAIRIALTGFNEERATQRVIILLTDGENHEGDVLVAAQEATEAGTIIYAIGFGSPEGAPIPEYNPQGDLIGFKRDRDGEVVLSRLDEATLQQIALTTNGRYFRATPDGREVGFLAEAISALQTTSLESRFETRRVERFQWFVMAAVFLLTLVELIPDRRRPRVDTEETSAQAQGASGLAKS